MRTLFWTIAFVVVLGTIIGTTIGMDVSSTPTASKGQCLLARRTLLPDVRVYFCTPAFDCTKATRPYALFFTQAATCEDGVIC
jgi:hypothetical protein